MKPPATKSGKQRKVKLKAKRAERKAKAVTRIKKDRYALDRLILASGDDVPVNVSLLFPNSSAFNEPDFVLRGYYEDQPFICKDCGKPQLWKATQQKWWYEVAHGDRHTIASRCRDCRRKERQRATDHRKRSEEGRRKV